MIEVKINNKKVSIDDTDDLGSGGEGTVYKLSDKACFKKYDDGYLDRHKLREKLIALCGKRDEFEKLSLFQYVSYPQHLGYELNHNSYQLCGFSMKLIQNCVPFLTKNYNLYEKAFGHELFTDDLCFGLVRQLFEMFAIFDSEKLIIGDVQPTNILMDSKQLTPYIIDFDSIKFDGFECSTNGIPDFIDPKVMNQKPDSQGRYIFSKDSDIFALTQICFEFVVGVNPFTPPVFPVPKEEHKLKLTGINYMKFSHEDSVVGDYSIADKSLFIMVKKRLASIKEHYPNLYQQFHHVLVDDGRTNLLGQVNKITSTGTIDSAPDSPKENVTPVRGYTRSKDRQDPDTFLAFINRFNLELP